MTTTITPTVPTTTRVNVQRASAMPASWRRRLVGTKSLRQQCVVAQALAESFECHPKCLPEVGVDCSGRQFIMVKLATGEKLQWFDEDVPEIVKRWAKAHDAGKGFRAFSFSLDAADAKISYPRPGRRDIDPETGQAKVRASGRTGSGKYVPVIRDYRRM